MLHMCVLKAQESIGSRLHEVDWQPHVVLFFTVMVVGEGEGGGAGERGGDGCGRRQRQLRVVRGSWG
jgi:hypothetical protein